MIQKQSGKPNQLIVKKSIVKKVLFLLKKQYEIIALKLCAVIFIGKSNVNKEHSLKQLAYVSKAQEFINEKSLLDILEFAVENNEKLDVTGFLLFGEGCFVQVIEGPQDNIDELYFKITQDERHQNVIKILYQDIDFRLFKDWQMSFRRFELSRDTLVDGFSDYLENYLSDNLHKQLSSHEQTLADHKIAVDIIQMMRKSYLERS